jgi:lipopolysaccharide biosynthesis regulator YciM
LTYQQVFALGHSFFQAGHYHRAENVFAALARIRGSDPRAKIMLARSKAEINDFEACNEILQATFEGKDEQVVEQLQAAFVFHTIGMRDNAIREMLKVVKQYPDCATAFLFLGDLYLERGDLGKADYCWKLAVKRDPRRAAVAFVARKQLGKLARRVKKARQKKLGTKRKDKKQE